MWGFVLSALTIAVSILTESGRDERMKSRRSGGDGGGGGRASTTTGVVSRGWSTLVDGMSRDALTSRLFNDRAFLSGALLGLGISLLWATISKQFKIGEHCKQLVRTWWYWEKPEQIPFRVPVPLLQQATLPSSGATTKQLAFLQRNGHGLIREVVSPASASTYNLRVVTLVIGPGRELSPSRSNGVEFYYVLTGSGVVSQQGIAATSQIRAGDCFIVDVGQMRWIANPDAVTEDLVLLRASDGLSSGCGIGRHDIIRLDPNRRATTTIDAIKDSVRHMHSLARDYVNGVAE